MKPNSNIILKSNFAGIFLFWIILNSIDFGFLDTNICYSGDLPWEPNTEYLQEAGFFKDRDIPYLGVFNVSGLEKIAVSPCIFSSIFQLNLPFFIYKEKFSKQASLVFSPLSFFLARSKFNIPHLNHDDEDPPSFPLEVVKIS